ncbi:AI-2E family transporter [Phenylobacterium sp. LjRoot225]|uniref:AI-2E family transporter n=1 Tax=Phenylobacterium sp. LjRoot225 TaxID=3342285 RepID=UPI003ECD867F
MEPPRSSSPRDDLQRGVLLVLGLVALGLLAVRLADVLLMTFGAGLIAVLLHAIAEPLQRRAKMGRTAALTVAVLVVALAVVATVWTFGRQVEAQFASLSDLLPRAWVQLQARLSASPLGAAMLRELDDRFGAGWLIDLGPKVAAQAAGAVAGTVIVFFAGLYLAYHPESYLRGFLRLFPPRLRARARTVLEATGLALKQWLVGQLFSMILVGVTTGVGLALVGVPSAFALGVIAGIGQFVPVVGPMAATVPGLLVSLAAGPQTFLWAGAVYLAASQLEANLITPLILRRLAQLPMAVTLFAVLAMGVLLGPLGVLFATPLAVVVYVLTKMVYVEGVLADRPAELGAEDPKRAAE